MAIKYILVKRTNPQHENNKEYFYAKTVRQGHVSGERLAEEVQSRSSLTTGDCKNVFANVGEITAEHLNNGLSVEIPGIGTIYVDVKSEAISSQEENAGNTVRLAGPKLRPCKELVKKLFTPIHRMEGDKKRVIQENVPKSIRLEKALAYLQLHKTMTRAQYEKMTHVAKATARNDLSFLIQTNQIQLEGRGPHTHYVLKEKNPTY